MTVVATTSQTVGPFFSIGLSQLSVSSTYDEGVEGRAITISGQIFDGEGISVPDAQLEFWQADSNGFHPGTESNPRQTIDPRFRGFARIGTDCQGAYQVHTIIPGRTATGSGGVQAPHIAVLVFLRGILRHLMTRIYFSGNPANPQDTILQMVPPERRNTLMAYPIEGNASAYLWNIRLQGEQETVFFQC